MKKTLAILFFLFILAVGVVSSPWGREKLRQILVAKLQTAGVHVELKKFQGTFPYSFHIEGLHVETDSFALDAQSVECEISLLRLLRSQLGFNSVKGDGITWVSKGPGKLTPPPFPIYVKQFLLTGVQSPELSLEGSVKLGRHKSAADVFVHYGTLPKTEVLLHSPSWQEVVFAVPEWDIEGKLDREGDWEVAGADWKAAGRGLEGSLQGLVFGQFSIAKNEKGVDIAVSQLYYETFFLESASLHIEPGFFQFGTRDMAAHGTWDLGQLTVQEWKGTIAEQPFELKAPTTVYLRPLTVEPFTIQVADGSLTARKTETEMVVQSSHLPLQLLSPNLSGWADIDAMYKDNKGTFQLKVHETNLGATGEFEGHFDPSNLDLKGRAALGNKPLLSVDLSRKNKTLSGEVTFQGRIEDLLDFADFGSHRLEGDAQCQFTLGGTLSKPTVSGSARLDDGFYQNYYTGTELKSIQAELIAERNKLVLTSFRADHVTANGEMRLGGKYPFELHTTFVDFPCIAIDLVTAHAKGSLHIRGDKEGAVAEGDIEMLETLLSIPDHIPRPLPELQVVYKNPTKPVSVLEGPVKNPYPLQLDVHVSAPSNIWVDGRGLHSEWKGQFDVGGTYTSPQAKGNIELIQGEFSFSARTFKLSEGALSLSGQEHEMPYLNIVANTELQGVSIAARIHGPLNNPQITLQSDPPLPISSIMSYLLFGQDLSEISGFQALQLASSVASLLGQGPDVMESTRRSLGIDRLRVITSSDGDQEHVAIEVGKYVANGVLVSFSQGAEDNSSNISVEVEIAGGFVFQVETLQEQEQGRFTLKWKLNY